MRTLLAAFTVLMAVSAQAGSLQLNPQVAKNPCITELTEQFAIGQGHKGALPSLHVTPLHSLAKGQVGYRVMYDFTADGISTRQQGAFVFNAATCELVDAYRGENEQPFFKVLQ